MDVLFHLFASSLLLVLSIAGLLLILAPSYGRRMLKNAAAFAGLFILGATLLQVCCSMFTGGRQ